MAAFFRARLAHLFAADEFAFAREQVFEQARRLLPEASATRIKRKLLKRAGAQGTLTTLEAASLLGVSRNRVRQWLDRGQLQGSIVSLGGRELWSIPTEEIAAALERERMNVNKTAASDEAGALTLRRAADLLGVSWKSVRDLRDHGLLGHRDTSVHFNALYERAAIDSLLKRLRDNGGPQHTPQYLPSLASCSIFPRPATMFDKAAGIRLSELVLSILSQGLPPDFLFLEEVGLRQFGYQREVWDGLIDALRPDFITQQQAARILSCSPLSIRTMLNAGVLKERGDASTLRRGSGRAQLLCRRSLLDISNRLVSTSALSKLLRMSPNGLRLHLKATKLSPAVNLGTAETTFWPRGRVEAGLARRGILVSRKP